jgi:sRNA-binding protein
MDLRVYYSRVREVECALEGAHVVLVSMETQDGGKAGVMTEAPRHVAAKQIAEGRARVSTAEEADNFHADNLRRKRERDDLEAMNRVQFVVMPQKHSGKPAKE